MNTDTTTIACQTALSFTRHRELLHKALPDPADIKLFNRLMAEARAHGMTWMDGLEYIIDRRRAMLN